MHRVSEANQTQALSLLNAMQGTSGYRGLEGAWSVLRAGSQEDGGSASPGNRGMLRSARLPSQPLALVREGFLDRASWRMRFGHGECSCVDSTSWERGVEGACAWV